MLPFPIAPERICLPELCDAVALLAQGLIERPEPGLQAIAPSNDDPSAERDRAQGFACQRKVELQGHPEHELIAVSWWRLMQRMHSSTLSAPCPFG